MNELREKYPVVYCVFAAVLGVVGMALVDWLWTTGMSAGLLAGIDVAVPQLGISLVKLVPFVLAVVLLAATNRTFLLRRTSNFARGLACGAFLICFAGFMVFAGVSRALEGEATMPTLPAVVAFVVNYLLVGLGEETLGRAVMAQTLLERFGTTRRGLLAACGLSGLIFGLMHLVNLAFAPLTSVIAQVVSAAFAGVLLAAIYFRCGNVWVTVVVHALYDMGGSVASLFNAASTAAPVEESVAQAVALVMPMLFGVLLGCIALFLLRQSKLAQVQDAWAGIINARS